MKRILLSMVAITATFSLKAQVDTLTEFFTGTPILYPSASGYVSGNNEFGDLSKYMRFDSSNGITGNGTLTGTLLWIPIKEDNGGSYKVTVRDFTGGVAGAVLASETLSLASIDTSFAALQIAEGAVGYNVAVDFSTPVALTSSSDIIVGVELPTTTGDTIALITNSDGDYANAASYTWEEWSDNSFVSFVGPSSWGLNVAFAIYPVVNMVAGLVDNEINISAYPNPASTELTINVAGEATSVSIISMDGKVVATQDVNGASTTVDVSNLNAGVYFYEVAAANGEVVRNTFVKK